MQSNIPRKFFCLCPDKDKGVHHFDRDEIAILLTNVEPNQSWETPLQVVQIAETASIDPDGYPAGGISVKNQQYSCADGISKITCDRIELDAQTAPIGPFRWVVIFNKTAGRLMAFQDIGEHLAEPGDNIKIDFSTNGVYSGV